MRRTMVVIVVMKLLEVGAPPGSEGRRLGRIRRDLEWIEEGGGVRQE